MKQTFKEFLKPADQEYSEGPMSLVTHNGTLYKLDLIFHLTKAMPVTMIPLTALQWMIHSIDAGGTDEQRMKKADTKVPIIVTPQNGEYVIIDGYHRCLKAVKAGDKEIPARIVFHDVLAMARLGRGAPGDLNPYLESTKANVKEANVFFGDSPKYESKFEFADNLHEADREIFLNVFSARLQNKVMKLRRQGARAKYCFQDVLHGQMDTLSAEDKQVVLDCYELLDDTRDYDGKEAQDAIKTMKLYFK